MFLLLQLVSRDKKGGAALFPDRKSRERAGESGAGWIRNARAVTASSGRVLPHYHVAEL